MALTKVQITIDGVVYNVPFDWNEVAGTGTATITIDAPTKTSWHKDGHYYPISVDLEGTGGYMGRGDILDSHYDDKDNEYGNNLRLVVKEKVAPIIEVVHPLEGYILTVRDNCIKFYISDEIDGSTIDYSTLQVSCAGVDITDTVIATKTDLGYYCTAKIVDTPWGEYDLTVSVSDYDKNESSQTIHYEYLVLVTDRTKSDITRYEELHEKGLANMTDEEKAEWLSGMKGSYNYFDLNRVEKAVLYMKRRAKAYNLDPEVKTDWKETDFFTETQGTRYITNVHDICNIWDEGVVELVDIPETMDDLDYIGANNIEQAIIQIDDKLNEVASQYAYSGEFYGGEI